MNQMKKGNASDGNFMIPIRYSNQDFDEKQARAAKLADEGRAAGTIPPGYGYTHETFAQAEAEYKAAQEAYWLAQQAEAVRLTR